MVEQLKSALEEALSVRCTVSARVKSLSSITKSIERRQIHRGLQYKAVGEIFDDLHDLAGFRIVVDYPSGIQIAKAFVTQNFQLKSTNVFKADREVPDALEPTFPSFQNESHHVVLHPNAKHPLSPFCDTLFEIQILSLAESLYNRLAHPLLDKKSSGQLSIKEQKMIEVAHGLSLCYWICLSCMEDRLEGKESQEIPIPIQKAAQLDGDQTADMESFVKATPCSMLASGERIPIERCLDSVKDLSKQAMSSDQLHNRLSVLLKYVVDFQLMRFTLTKEL
jgi:ppGpp synthetase/RelA/SpoT-type nucleotidyltranferase